MVENLTQAFARNGKETHLRELRAAVFPLRFTLAAGGAAGWLVTVIPWLAFLALQVILALVGFWRYGQGSPLDSLAFAAYLRATWAAGLFLSAAGVALALIRRYSAFNNRYVILRVGANAEFRFGWDDIAGFVLLPLVLMALFADAREFSIALFFAGMVFVMIWKEFHDLLLGWYALFSRHHAPETITGVWELLRRNEAVERAVIEGVGSTHKGRTIVIRGRIPEGPARDLIRRLPIRLLGVERVDIVDPCNPR